MYTRGSRVFVRHPPSLASWWAVFSMLPHAPLMRLMILLHNTFGECLRLPACMAVCSVGKTAVDGGNLVGL